MNLEMTDLVMLAFGCLLISAVSLATIRSSQCKALLRWLLVRLGGIGRFPSPEDSATFGHQHQSIPKALSCLECHNVFPPSRRHCLSEIIRPARNESRKSVKDVEGVARGLLPDKERFDYKQHKRFLTPTGFTIEDVHLLGHFPDHAMLSGVPLPTAYKDFDIKKAKPRPYRPFRWAYHQNMSLMKMDPDWWLELESTYTDRVKQRQNLFAKHGPTVLDLLPDSELAAKELMEMVVQFLCARYPKDFQVDTEKMMLHNCILHTSTDLRSTEPIHVLLENVPEDFAIMIRCPKTGLYSFRGGMIFSSLGFSLGSKIGLQLHEIHEPVPDYKEKMRFSMDRYFAKLPTDMPIQRGSWEFVVDQPLFMAPDESSEPSRHVQDPMLTVDRCHLRVDWQTMRRLPLSGAIVFNFKTFFTPLRELRDEPYIPSLVLKVLREGNRKILTYKSTFQTEHVVMPALAGFECEQIDSGLISRNWDPRTLDESPFFPGWREKWHRQQGL